MTKNKKCLFLCLSSLLGLGVISATAFSNGRKTTATECAHNHVEHYDGVAPTLTKTGRPEHWACCDCGKAWYDANKTDEIIGRESNAEVVDFAKKTTGTKISKEDVDSDDLITSVNVGKIKWTDQNDNDNSPKSSTEDKMEYYSIDGRNALYFSFDYDALSDDDKARIKNGTTDISGDATTSGNVANYGYSETRFTYSGKVSYFTFEYKYWDLNRDLASDGGKACHMMAQAHDTAYNYEDLELINDNEWHTAIVQCEDRTIDFLILKIQHFHGELYLSNMKAYATVGTLTGSETCTAGWSGTMDASKGEVDPNYGQTYDFTVATTGSICEFPFTNKEVSDDYNYVEFYVYSPVNTSSFFLSRGAWANKTATHAYPIYLSTEACGVDAYINKKMLKQGWNRIVVPASSFADTTNYFEFGSGQAGNCGAVGQTWKITDFYGINAETDGFIVSDAKTRTIIKGDTVEAEGKYYLDKWYDGALSKKIISDNGNYDRIDFGTPMLDEEGCYNSGKGSMWCRCFNFGGDAIDCFSYFAMDIYNGGETDRQITIYYDGWTKANVDGVGENDVTITHGVWTRLVFTMENANVNRFTIRLCTNPKDNEVWEVGSIYGYSTLEAAQASKSDIKVYHETAIQTKNEGFEWGSTFTSYYGVDEVYGEYRGLNISAGALIDGKNGYAFLFDMPTIDYKNVSFKVAVYNPLDIEVEYLIINRDYNNHCYYPCSAHSWTELVFEPSYAADWNEGKQIGLRINTRTTDTAVTIDGWKVGNIYLID